jgi:hypothetical protein
MGAKDGRQKVIFLYPIRLWGDWSLIKTRPERKKS